MYEILVDIGWFDDVIYGKMYNKEHINTPHINL